MNEKPVGVITGGLSGIGAASALQFAHLGSRLLLLDRLLEGAEEISNKVRAAGGDALCVSVDVRDIGARQAIDEVVSKWGRVDFLLANAGVGDQSRVVNGDPVRWREVVETNLLGVMYSAHAVLPAMLEHGSGHILIMSSVSGRESYVGEPVYIASKWGLVGFAHSLGLELVESGIRVTVIEPGLVNTPLTHDNPKVRPLLEEIQPLNADDVARAVVFAYQQPPTSLSVKLW